MGTNVEGAVKVASSVEAALLTLLGGGAFGVAAAATLMASAWFGRTWISYLLNVNETRQDQILKASIDFKARQLSEFYWPIYIRLQKDKAIWDRILKIKDADDALRKIAISVESKDILPNHAEVVNVIETKFHLAQPDTKLQNEIQKYVRHVSLYKAMRDAGINDKFPYDLNKDESYPTDLFNLIKDRTERLQSDYDKLVASAGLSARSSDIKVAASN
jgi:hypothetical protein